MDELHAFGKTDEAQVFVREHTNPDIPVEDSDLSYKKRILLYAGYTPVETYIKEVVNYDDCRSVKHRLHINTGEKVKGRVEICEANTTRP